MGVLLHHEDVLERASLQEAQTLLLELAESREVALVGGRGRRAEEVAGRAMR